jgi:hypothetical protein
MAALSSIVVLAYALATSAQGYPSPHTNTSQVGLDVGYSGPDLSNCADPRTCPRIKWITFGTNTSYYTDLGDTYYNSIGPDGNVWFTSDDTSGIRGACLPNGSNVVVNKATGPGPTDLQASTVNCLKEWGLQADDQNRGDGGSWKTTGLTWIDSVLYLWVARNIYPPSANDTHRQSAQNACLLKSTDFAETFNGKIQSECFKNPDFKGRLFGTPSFVQYGRDGEAGPDGSDKYVYAVSNDGAWDNGGSVRLGRVNRSRIAHQRSEDWEYFRGAPATPDWTSNISDADPILSSPFQLSSAAAVYNPYLEEYILTQWYFPNRTGWGQYPDALYPSIWSFYASRKPWGPYRLVSNTSWPNAGWYNPVMVNKFWGFDGKSGVVFASGAGYQFDYGSAYDFSTIPFQIETLW